MNRKSSPLIRSISASLAAVFLFTQVLFAHNVQKSVWEERRLAARLPSVSSPALPGFDTNHIPAASILDRFVPAHQRPQIGNSILPSLVPLLSAHGVIKDIRLAKPDRARKGLEPPVLVYIQDVHGQTEAQSHMASMILKLLEIQPKALVGLEGAAGKIDVEKFRRASSEINKEIGEFFLETDLIGGPEMAAFAAKEAPRLWGVEDRDLYLKNVEAVRQALPKKKEWLTTVEKLKIDVREKKRSIYSPALKNLDEKAEAKESGDLSLGDYLAYLVGTAIPAKAGSQAVNTGLAPRFRGDDDFGYPTLSLFLKTWAIEKSLDFSAAEREREIFLSRLVQVMGKEELKRLVETSVAFKSGVVSYPDYYRGLRDAAQRAGLEISNYPHFETFIRYTLQADAINAEAFLKEMGRYEEAVWRSLCRTKEQEELVQTSAGVGLLEKLVRLNLTTDEWKKVLTERESIHRLVPANEVSRLRPFEKFYEVAEARNEAMVNNLLKRHPRASRHPRESGDPGCKPSVLDSRLRGNDVGSRLSILVAGGFHGAGLKDLIPKDFTLVTVAPKLVDVDSKEGAEYLSVFTRERTPLEKLFESPRISLSRTLSLAPLERTEASIAVGVLSNSLPALWPELRRNGSAHARFGRLGVWVRDLGGRAVKKAFPFGTLVFSRASGQREVSLYDLQAPWGTAGSRILSPVYRLKKAFTEHFAFVPAVLVPTLTATIPIVLKLFVPNLPLNMPLLLIMSAAAGIVAIAISLDDIVRRHGLTHSRPGLRQLYFTIPLLELSALVSALAAFGLMSPLLSLVSLPWAIVLIVVTMLNAGVLAYLVGHSLINGLSVFIPSLAPLAGINWLSDKTETLKMDVSSYAEHGNGLALFPLAVLMQRFAQLDGPTKEFMVEKLLRLMEFSTLAVIIRESMISRSVKVIGDITMEELALAFDALKAGDWTKCAEMQGRLTPSPESIETKNFLSALAYIMERGFPFPSGPARAGVGKEKEAPLEPAPPAASSPQERFARSLRENSLTDLTEWKKAYEHYVEIGDLEGAEYFLGLICRANYSLFEPAEAAVFGPLLNLYNDHTSARDQREKSDVKKFNQLKDTFRKCLSDIDLFRMTEARENLTILEQANWLSLLEKLIRDSLRRRYDALPGARPKVEVTIRPRTKEEIMRLGAAPPRPAPRAPSAADMADLESSAQELVKLMEAYRQSVRRGRWFGAGPSGIYSDMTRLLKENPGLNNRSDLGVPQFMGAIRGQYVIVRQRGESTNRAIASLFSECGSALHTGQTAIAHARLKALRKYQQGGQLVGFEIEGLDGLETRLKSMEPQAGEETSKGAKSPKGGRTAAGAPKAPEKPKAEKKRPADIDKSLSEAFQKCGEALTASNLDEARRWIGEIEKLRAHLTLDEQTQLDGLKKECGLLKDLQKQVPARYQSVLKGLEGGDDQTARKLLAQLEGIQRAHPRLIGAIQKMLQDLREKLPPQEPQVPSTIQATKPAPQSETPAAVPPKAEIPPVAQPVAAVEPVSVAPPPVFTFEPVPFVEVTTSKPPSRPQPHADQLEAGLSDSKALPSPLSVGPPDEIPQEDYPPMTPDDYMLLRDREPDQAKIIRLAFEGTVQAIREGDFNYLADMVDVLSQYELTGPERARLDGLEEQLRRGASVAQEPAPIQIGDSRHSPEKAAPSDRTADHLAPPSAKEPKVEEPVSKPPPLPGAWRKLTATQDDYRIVQGRSGVHEFIIHSAFDRAEGAAREGKIEFLSSMLGVLRQYQLTSYESAHVAELEGQLRAMQASAAQASAEFTHPESVAQKREEPAPLKRADDRVVPPAAAVKPERVVPPPLPREDVPSPVSYDSRLSADGKALYDHLLGLGFFDLSKHAETGTVTERHFVPTVAENRGKIEIRAQLAGDQLKIISIDIPGPGDSGRYPQKSEAVQILANTEGGQLITWDGNALWLFDYAEEGSLVHVWAGASHLKKSVPSLPRNSGEPANPNVLRDLVKAIQGAGPIRRAFIDLSTKEAPLCLEVKAGKHILFRNQRGASSIRRADSLPSRKPAVPQTPIAPLKQPVPPKPEASGKPKVPPTAPEIERESPRPSSFKSFWDGLSDHDREVFGRRDQNDADQIGVIFRAAEEGSKQGAAEWLRVVLADLSKYKLTTAEIKRRDELSAQLAELERRAKPDGLQAEPVTEPARETPKYKLTPPLSSQPARASVRVDEVQAAQAHDKFIELRKRLVEALRTLDRKTALSIVDGDMRVMRPQFSPRQRTLGILLTDKTRFEIGHAEGMNSGDREGLKEAFSECEALLARGDIRQVKEWLSLIETIWRSEGLTFYEFEWYETLQGRVAYIGNPDGFNLPSKLQLGIIEEFYQRALRGLNENRLQLSDLLLETLEEGQKWFPRLLSARHLEILDSLKKDLDLELEEPAAPPTAVDKERESSVGLDTERESPVAPGLKRASTAPPDASIFMDDLRQRVNDILDRLIKFAFHEAIGPYLTNVPASQKSDFHKKLELLCNISWIRPEGSARWAFAIGVALESLSPEQKKAVGLTYSLQRSAEIVRILIEEIDVFQHPDLKGANQIEDTLAAAWLFNALPKDPLIATNLRLFIQEATNGEIRGFVNVLSFGNRAYEDDPAALKLLFQANELFKKRPHAGDQSLGPSHTGNWWGVLKETKYFIPPAVPLFLGSWILLGLYVYLRPQIGVLPIVLFFGVRTVCVLVAVLFFVTAGPISLRIVRSMNFVPAFVQPHFEYLKRIGKYDSYFPTGEDQRSFISYLVLHFLLFMNVVLASSCVMMGVTLPVFLEFPNYWTAFLIPGLSAVFGLVALLVVHTVIFLFFRWRGELPPSAGWNRRSRRYETDGNLREKLKAAMEGRRWSEADGTAATLRDRAKIRMRIHPPDETRRLLVEYEMRRAPIVGKRDGKLSYWYGLAKDYLESPYRGHGHELTEAWFAFRYLSSSFLKMREDKKSLYLDLIKTIRRTLSLTSLRRQNGWGDPERDMKKSFVEAVDSLWNMNPRPAEELIQQLNQYKTEGDVDFIGESLHLAAALEFLLSVKAAPRPAVLAEASGSILPYRWYKLWVAGWAEFPLALLLWLVVAPSSLSGLAPWASIVINATAVAFIFYALHGIARVLYWLFDHVYYGASMPREWPSLSSRIMGVLTAGAFLVAASFYCSGLGGIFAFLVAPSFFNNGPGEIFFIAVVLFSVMHHRMNRLVDNLQSFLKDDLAKDLLVGNWVQARMSVQSLGPSSRSVLERVKSLIEHNTRDMYWKGNLEGAISFLEQFESLYSLLSPPSRRLPQRLPSPLLSLMREDKKDETITAVERLQSAFNFTSDALGDEGFNLSDAYNGIKSLTSRLPLVQGKERIRYGDLVTSFYQKGSFLDVAAGKEEKDPLWLDFFYSVDALLRGNAKEARRVFKDLRRSLRYAPRCAGPLSALEYLLAVYDPKGQWLDVVAQRWEYFIVPSNLLFSLGLYSSFSALSPPLVMGFGLLLGVMTLFFPGFENAYLKSHRRIIDVYRYLFPKESDVASYGRYLHRRYWALNLIPVFLQTVIYGVAAAYFILPAETASFSIRRLFVAVLAFALSHFLGWAAHLANNKWGRWRGVLGAYTLTPPTGPEEEPAESIEGTIGEVVEWLRTRNRGVEADSLLAAHGIGILEVPEIRLEGPPSFRWAARSDPRPIYIDGQTIVVSDPRALSIPRSLVSAFRQIVKSRMDHLRVTEKEAYAYRVLFESADHLAERLRLPTLDELRKIGEEEKLPLELLLRRRVARTLSSYVDVEPTAASDKLSGASLSIADAFVQCLKSVAADNDRLFLARSMALSLVCQASRGDVSLVLRNADVVRLLLGGKYYPQLYSMKDSLEIIASAWLLGVSKTDRLMEALLNPHVRDLVRTVEYRSLPRDDDPPGVKILREAFRRVSNPNDSMSLVPGPAWWVKGVAPFIESLVLGFVVVASAGFIPYLVSLLFDASRVGCLAAVLLVYVGTILFMFYLSFIIALFGYAGAHQYVYQRFFRLRWDGFDGLFEANRLATMLSIFSGLIPSNLMIWGCLTPSPLLVLLCMALVYGIVHMFFHYFHNWTYPPDASWTLIPLASGERRQAEAILLKLVGKDRLPRLLAEGFDFKGMSRTINRLQTRPFYSRLQRWIPFSRRTRNQVVVFDIRPLFEVGDSPEKAATLEHLEALACSRRKVGELPPLIGVRTFENDWTQDLEKLHLSQTALDFLRQKSSLNEVVDLGTGPIEVSPSLRSSRSQKIDLPALLQVSLPLADKTVSAREAAELVRAGIYRLGFYTAHPEGVNFIDAPGYEIYLLLKGMKVLPLLRLREEEARQAQVIGLQA